MSVDCSEEYNQLNNLFDYIYEKKDLLVEKISPINLQSNVIHGYIQSIICKGGFELEKSFKEVLTHNKKEAHFIDVPDELKDYKKYKKFDHFIEYNNEYYCIEQKTRDNHDNIKTKGELSSIENFPNESEGKKINKCLWFVSRENGKATKSNDVKIYRGENIFKIFFNNEEKCLELYNEMIDKIKPIDCMSIVSLDENYEEKIDCLYKQSGKTIKDFDKYINDNNFMMCIKSLSTNNKFYNAFIDMYYNACGVIKFTD